MSFSSGRKSGIRSLIHPNVKSCTLRDLVTLSGTIIQCTDRLLNRLRMLEVFRRRHILGFGLLPPYQQNLLKYTKKPWFSQRNIKTTHSGICEAAYKTIVRPQLEYASTTWSPYTKQEHRKRGNIRLCQGEVDAVKRGPKINLIKKWGKGGGG